MSAPESSSLNVEAAVRDRYGAAANAAEAALCCPVSYDTQYLQVIPSEIIERDYGCGDPSQYLQAGDDVLDLGSGGGKICYIASQVVGESGSVIGVDINDEMLGLARQYQDEVAAKIGYRNTSFRKGRIQDLRLDVDAFEAWLADNPVRSAAEWMAAEAQADRLRQTAPLVADDSVDAVVSNCVLNLVRNEDRQQLFADVFRVLRQGGRAVISDIVSDEDVPESLQNDAHLWSGCISGAFREDRFLEAFEQAGFYGLEIVNRQQEPWAVVEGIEFRSLTVRAWKGNTGACLERNQAVIYNGPWKAVLDDNDQELHRGHRMAVCSKTYRLLSAPPYSQDITLLPPATEIPSETAAEFDCDTTSYRPPGETKQGSGGLNVLPGDGGDCCGDTGCC